MAVQVILLEKVEKLGAIGDTVAVKPGYARNFLLPQGKALRATTENIAYFEKEKAAIEKVNAEKRKEAEKEAKKLDGATATIIRAASESGQLYGGINASDIAEAVATKGVSVRRGQIDLNQSFKTIGLFTVNIILHPEVIVPVQLNVARSEDEAAVQLKTGKALIAAGDADVDTKAVETKEEEFLDEAALKVKEEAEAETAEETKKTTSEEATEEVAETEEA